MSGFVFKICNKLLIIAWLTSSFRLFVKFSSIKRFIEIFIVILIQSFDFDLTNMIGISLEK